MLYKFLKPLIRIAMFIFCRRIVVNKPADFKRNGPLLLACNHPNSFLDAAILADLFEAPVYSLARGDVFKTPFYRKLLAALKILPVYRSSEGVENLAINYKTFDACKEIFKKGGVVLIFSEAKCINEWHLRALKKGTARLAFSAWSTGIPLEVLPVGINYSSFRRFSKNMFINFGEPIKAEAFNEDDPDGKKNQLFNDKLREQLETLVYEIGKHDLKKQKMLLEKKPSILLKLFLFLPATAGWLLHLPLYLPVKKFTYRRTKNNDHYDSVLVALLLFTYPFYVLLIAFIVWLLSGYPLSWLLLIIFPITAWAYTQLKPQLDRIIPRR